MRPAPQRMTVQINVLQTGNRLEIIANIDLTGLPKLKEMLDHYEKILKLLK